MYKRPPPYRANSPLERVGVAANAQGYSSGDTWIGERITSQGRHLAVVNLRMNPEDRSLSNKVADSLGFKLPSTPCSVVNEKNMKAVWISPDEWLLISETILGRDTIESLEKICEHEHISAVNLSSNYVIIRLSGPFSEQILGKLVPVDLHPTVFKTDMAIGTVAGKANTILIKIDDTPTFDLIVRRSFSTYLWLYLQDSGLAYNLRNAGQI